MIAECMIFLASVIPMGIDETKTIGQYLNQSLLICTSVKVSHQQSSKQPPLVRWKENSILLAIRRLGSE